MPVDHNTPTAQRAPAKGRILEHADELFTAHGIVAVGVDRIIAASSVTKATFYKHYRAKDNLITAYLERRDEIEREELLQLTADMTARQAVENIVADTIERMSDPQFRGSAFANAASEFPVGSHPVRELVRQHREWYVDHLHGIFSDAGHPLPGDAADDLMLARDGALSGGFAGDSIAAAASLQRISATVLSALPRD